MPVCRASSRRRFADFELLLVDDESPGQLPEICDAWAERTRASAFSTRPNGPGLSGARNAGAGRCGPRRLTMVDSDDTIAP